MFVKNSAWRLSEIQDESENRFISNSLNSDKIQRILFSVPSTVNSRLSAFFDYPPLLLSAIETVFRNSVALDSPPPSIIHHFDYQPLLLSTIKNIKTNFRNLITLDSSPRSIIRHLRILWTYLVADNPKLTVLRNSENPTYIFACWHGIIPKRCIAHCLLFLLLQTIFAQYSN